VLLPDQDRTLWDHERIAEGVRLLERALRMRRAGRYQVEAAIAAVHAEAERAEDTDWRQIVALYGQLMVFTAGPIVVLNRAAAISQAEGASAGLEALHGLGDALDGYGPYHAAQADMLRRAGRTADAAEAYGRALALAGNDAERAFLRARRDALPARPERELRCAALRAEGHRG